VPLTASLTTVSEDCNALLQARREVCGDMLTSPTHAQEAVCTDQMPFEFLAQFDGEQDDIITKSIMTLHALVSIT
jgi:hypothetical protein